MCKEETVVSSANAVVNPRTMVVEFLNAPIADIAVSTPGGSDYFTERAKRTGFKGF